MRKIILFLAILIIAGCIKQNDEIELITPSDENYIFIEKIYSRDGRLITQVYNISDEQVKKVSTTLEGIKNILLKSKNNFEISSVPQGIPFKPNSFLYTLYINEGGKITKVVAISSLSKEVDKYVVEQMRDWEMEIFTIDNKPVKYSINWELSLFKPKGENKLSLLSSNLKVSENIEVSETPNEEDYFVAVEEMPYPIGGIKAIQEKIVYPETAKKEGIEGRVYVKAFINENGDVVSAEVIKGIGAGCDQEAISAVVNTKFKPARQNGKLVKVQVSIPILFKLN